MRTSQHHSPVGFTDHDLEFLVAVSRELPVGMRSAFLHAIVEVAEDKERRAGLRPPLAPQPPRLPERPSIHAAK
jgi:hypothetical protein